ncbi:MAG: CHAT domain-containing protein, partial [Bacteroidales bacterium]|nr:CHAT domain-containing protein [Bacteroidales bacterium]
MKKLILTLILALSFVNNNAQTVIDSLKTVKTNIERAKKFNADHYLTVFYSLANIYLENGDYYSLGLLTDDMIDVYKVKLKHENNYYVRELVTSLASFHYRLYNVQSAMFYANNAEEMYSVVKDFNNPTYWELLTLQSTFNFVLNDTIKAKKYVERAYNLFSQGVKGDVWNPDNVNKYRLQSLINNFGNIYASLGDYSLSEKFYRLVINSFDNKFSLETIGSYFNLAYLLYSQSRYKESIDLMEKIIAFSDNRYNNYHYYNILIDSYIQLNDTTNVMKYLTMFNNNAFNNILYNFSKFSDANLYDYWLNESKNTLDLNSWAIINCSNPIVNTEAFEMNIYFRFFILHYPQWVYEFIKQTGDQGLMDMYQDYLTSKNNYVFGQNSQQHRDQAMTTEMFMINQLNGIEKYIAQQYRNVDQIRDFLSEGEYVVQFCDLSTDLNHKDNFLQDYFSAFVFGKNMIYPIFYILGHKYEIGSFYNFDGTNEPIFYSELYSKDKASRLNKLVFQPLERFFRGGHTIYYAPSSLPSFFNFDLLTDSLGIPLNEKYKMVRVSSIYEIPQVKARDLQNLSSAALYGNINYDTSFYDSSRGSKFGRLKNAGKEINSISNILKGQNITSTIFDRTSATEESFKNLSGKSPEILHLATHGFCFETDEKAADKPFAQNVNSYSQKESAMVLSGLALSG